ncbi:nicotinamide mononucleotide transporter PnuC [Owenweeksia hongkongensis DSM 17368]|uniref:Nicotinamide riboside transporter PnuC n=1 Tax=Owenweeksia hongkongensis (strain DSM 17368 / CIP 108786 / JCM 12287 / NRRL B-23963 / UST20020801) TaxID=926562 RepID=G8R0T5_OWEHD|nr:nicotinamide riboside transporter PnuC [Owenweeksia hongkongensis]AEV33812.1 nicotinamide mononucleotide transporter PnuC [Owenweeksia hongkongensis DSM 17368]
MTNKGLKWLEGVAVVAGLSYTLLITYGYVWCWIAAIISSLLFLYICFIKRIYAESLLQAFYIFTSIYGWMHWNDSGGGISGSLSWSIHGMIILSGTALVIITGALLKKMTDAATPYIDSFTTVFSIFATLLMINLIPDNWWYWIVIDAVSVYLYYKRKLYFATALFVLYTLLAVNGLLEWTA